MNLAIPVHEVAPITTITSNMEGFTIAIIASINNINLGNTY